MTEYSQIAIMGDIETISGFELAGFSRKDGNALEVLDIHNKEEVIKMFEDLVQKKEIAIILVCDFVAVMIEPQIKNHVVPLPSILIIPSKNAKCTSSI